MRKHKIKSKENRYLRALAGTAAALAALCMLTVYLLDPFYHYHKPWFGLKAVLNEKEYQVPGSLRHFDYDSVLVGSSVVETSSTLLFSIHQRLVICFSRISALVRS